jgi:hypothetical protein
MNRTGSDNEVTVKDDSAVAPVALYLFATLQAVVVLATATGAVPLGVPQQASTMQRASTTANAVMTYDGTTYAARGVTQSNPGSVSVRPGGVASVGWIFGDRTAAGTNSFMNGDGAQGFISVPTPFDVNDFLAITHAYGGSTALEIGVASPGSTSFGVSPFSHPILISGSKGN